MEADALTAWLDQLIFADLATDEVTARIADTVAEWGASQGWRVYRRAPSVLMLPPPLVVEIDHTDRRRTVDKLLAEAEAGRIAIWVRWGTGPFRPPPMPVQMATVEVTRRSGRRFARAHDLIPPAHGAGIAGAEETPLFVEE